MRNYQPKYSQEVLKKPINSPHGNGTHQAIVKLDQIMSVFKKIHVNNVNDYINLMKAFANDNYVFRGQPDKTILPSVFRPHEIEKMNSEFPGKKTEDWLNSPEARIPVVSLEKELQNRMISALSFVCQYNYCLTQYIKNNQSKFHDCIVEKYTLNAERCWNDNRAFEFSLNQNTHTLIGKIGIDGNIINYSSYPAPLEYTSPYLPQHYDVKTAALDWTRNYNKALHFALNSDTHCIFICDKSTNNGKPFRFVEHDETARINERMIKQEGLFMQIHDEIAILFYLFHGRWPSVDDFILNGSSQLQIIKVTINTAQRDSFREYLNLKGINDQSLGLVPRLQVAW